MENETSQVSRGIEPDEPVSAANWGKRFLAGLLLGVLGCAAFCMVDEPVAVLHEYGLETGMLPRHSVSKVALLTLARLPKGWFSTAGTR